MKGMEILKEIIKKGGLYGATAKFYLNDEDKIRLFINECYQQCHNKSVIKLWGEELISDIQKYTKENAACN